MKNLKEVSEMIAKNMGSELTPLQNTILYVNCSVTDSGALLSYLKEKGFTFNSVQDARLLQHGNDLIDYIETLSPSELENYRQSISLLYKDYCSFKKERMASLGGR